MARPNPKKQQTVNYRAASGRTKSAVVEAVAGSVLSLYVPHLTKSAQHKTGIAKRTSYKQTNVWW